MIDTSDVRMIQAFLVGFGVLLTVMALYETFKTRSSYENTLTSGEEEKESTEPVLEPELTLPKPPVWEASSSGAGLYEIPDDYLPPGELQKTMKIPPFIQTFKFRERGGNQVLFRV